MFSTNPVEDNAKYQICMTFGSILYKINWWSTVNEMSDFMLHRTNGKFHFSPCGRCFYIVIQNWMRAEAVLINIKLLINGMHASLSVMATVVTYFQFEDIKIVMLH